VTDTAGNPVDSLEVSVWSFLSIGWPGPTLQEAGTTSRAARNASTIINYVVESAVSVTVDFLDLNNKVVDSVGPLDAGTPGVYTITWVVPPGLPNGVYRYRMRAVDSTGVLFEDTKYCVLSRQERANRVVGYTNAHGSFATENEVLFPGHLNLPPMPVVDVTGQEIGTFDVLDSVQITVVDTTHIVGVTVNRVVGEGVNSIDILWKSPASLQALWPAVSGARDGESHRPPDLPPFVWTLRQNYPNPIW
jgi:hypothetical protein